MSVPTLSKHPLLALSFRFLPYPVFLVPPLLGGNIPLYLARIRKHASTKASPNTPLGEISRTLGGDERRKPNFQIAILFPAGLICP